ncbi:MAG TPA: hypothetical protein VE685_14430 [Thermoanaerobaculia bacterium]|nr:hypothetical protein [Thermoanaerobaculia bacterium]
MAQDDFAEDPELERDLREINEALDECEEDIATVDRDMTILRQDMSEFLGFLQDSPGATGDDLVRLFKRFVQQEMRFQSILNQCMLKDEARRQTLATLQDGRLKARLLEICDRRIDMLRLALETCAVGKQTLLDVSDELAALESQGMFLNPFWGDQVH